MKNIIKVAAAAIVAMAITQTVSAVPITGNIGFSGSAVLNSGSVNSASQVVSWGTTVVNAESGSFNSIVIGSAVSLFSPWNFNSGTVNNFWSVGGFVFSLSSSSIFSQGGGFLNVILNGTVTGNGFDATAFSGSFQVADPAANQQTQTFTERLSFNSVPDGGTTVLLLGAALSGLAMIKRKLVA